MTASTEDILLERAQGGDPAALDELIARYQPLVYRFGLKMCRNPEDAKDVLQDTLLSMARGIRSFRGGAAVSTWLYTIARNACIKKHRKGVHAPSSVESLDQDNEHRQVADDGGRPDDALASKRIELALTDAIAALDPNHREVLLLRDVEGLSANAVAEVVGISVPAVKSRLHRARLAVRAELAPLLGVTASPASQACPDVLSLYSQHVEGEISSAMCADMERHLEGCADCRAKCDSLKTTLSLCQAAPAGEVPASVQAKIRAAVVELAAVKKV